MNDTTYYVVVDSLNANGQATDTSCEVAATPKVLSFGEDLRVNQSDNVTQSTPDLACAWDGFPLFLAWEEEGCVLLARSDNLDDTWATPITMWGQGGAEAQTSLAFRRRVAETDPVTGGTNILV